MRSLDPAFLAACQAPSYRAGYALHVTLASEWGVARHWRYTSVPGGVTIGGQAYTAWPLVIQGAPQYGSAALSDMSVCIGDAAATGLLEVRNDPQRLRWRAAEVFELAGLPGAGLTAETMFLGAVQGANPKDGWLWLGLGPDYPPWARRMPEIISARCRYRSTGICPHALECQQSEDACDTLGRLGINGGFLYLQEAGTRVSFRDGGVTVGGGEGAGRRARKAR